MEPWLVVVYMTRGGRREEWEGSVCGGQEVLSLACRLVAWWSVFRAVQGKEEETEKDKTEWSPG
jgi:hypothetical protein